MFTSAFKVLLLVGCIAGTTMVTSQTARADLGAESSYGFNWAGKTYVGGWVANTGVFPYSQAQGRRVQLYFFYPTTGTWELMMDKQIGSIPAGQTRAYHEEIYLGQVDEQPVPILLITGNDINPNNNWTATTVWLGSF